MSRSLPIQIVDENDSPIEARTIEEAQQKGLWHRIVRVMIQDSQGRILLQKRRPNLELYPDCWDTSIGGHVDAGEDYLTAAKRETTEETGLSDVSLREVEYYRSQALYRGRTLNRFNKTYTTVVSANQKFVPDPHEVAEFRWFTLEEARRLLEEQPESVTDGLQHFLTARADNESHSS